MATQQLEATNLFLTFKVLECVQQLRRRVKLRVRCGSVLSSQLGTEPGLDGVRALGQISTGGSQVSFYSTKQTRRDANRVSKTRTNNPRAIRTQARLPDVPVCSNTSGEEVQHMLSALDSKLSAAGSTLSAIAGDDKLFLKQSSLSIFEGRPLSEAVQCLAAIHHAIQVLSECRSQYSDVWLAAQGDRIGLSIDEKFIANYEHLLLRLQAELIEVIARKALAELLRGGHNKQQRKLLSWFTEFAEKPRPLSTSFPWTIKSSLAVLWGVCWMFYDYHSDDTLQNDFVRVPKLKVLQQAGFEWDPPSSSAYRDLGLELTATEAQPAMHQQARPDLYEDFSGNVLQEQLRNSGSWQSDYNNLMFRLPSEPTADQAEAIGSSSHSSRFPGQPLLPHCIYPPDVHQGLPDNNQYLPPDEPLPAFSNPEHQSWQLPCPPSPPRTNPCHFVINTTPSIRVIGATEDNSFAAPHNSASLLGSTYQVDNPRFSGSPPNTDTNTEFLYHKFIMPTNTLLPGIPVMPAPPPSYKHERTSSVNSISDIPTPVSMADSRSPLPSPTYERIHIRTESRDDVRENSEGISSQDGDDTELPLKNDLYKRTEDPPRNQEGRMVCKYQDCNNLTFDRKCEWSKHMDKHDRPYKCNVKGCEKLQGFTYSGGLLRHKREVHKMHGGTKKSLFCPFTDCKRSSGAGFTRKENLAEHIRRVHRRTSMSADLNGLIIPRRQSQESSPLIENRQTTESPYIQMVEYREDDEISRKRKRISVSSYSDHGDEDLRAEIKRLRQQNEEKDTRLKQLEQAVMALQQNRR